MDNKAAEWKEREDKIKAQNGVLDHYELNVGGKFFKASKAVLCKEEGSILESMFSGKYPLKNKEGSIFIDRDPLVFKLLLNFLETD
jgi:hypothetical protein